MTKTYRADNTIVCISLFIAGRNIKINFRPSTAYLGARRGSVYTTSNELIQEALEKNARFNNTYYLESEYDNSKTVEEKLEEEKPKVELQEVSVASLADAKTWLQENKGWEPKNRVTKKILVDAAYNFGVKFVGLQ